jgi:predicted O-linked N-acetylglucosamine transferase (SPINDLY family)
VGATLLGTIGRPEWVATDEADYVRRVLQLAGDAAALNELRMNLRERLRDSPLCRHADFTRQLEAAYRSMWCRRCASGRRPE